MQHNSRNYSEHIRLKTVVNFIGMFSFFSVLSLPLLFQALRTALFQTIPFDDYAEFLLTILGRTENFAPLAPMHYRILSILPAALFTLVPEIPFSRLPALDPAWRNATQAIVIWSWMCIVLSATVIFAQFRYRQKSSFAAAIVGAMSTIILAQFLSTVGVDGPFILFVTLLAVFSSNPTVFVPLIIIAPFVNEKLPIIFAAQFVARRVTAHFSYAKSPHNVYSSAPTPQLLASLAGCFVYFAIRFFLNFPGNENQLDFTSYPAASLNALQYLFTVKGFILNGIPVALIFALFFLAIYVSVNSAGNSKHLVKTQISFQLERADIVLPFIFVALAIVADVQFNLGRIAMLLFPLTLVGIAARFDKP